VVAPTSRAPAQRHPGETASATGPAQSTDPDLAARPANDLRKDSPRAWMASAAPSWAPASPRSAAASARRCRDWAPTPAGKPLPADDSNDGCYFLRPQDAEDPRLMIEARKLVRYDVRSAAIIAPGGGKVGMTLGELQVLYPSARTSAPTSTTRRPSTCACARRRRAGR
jgi:hypothetical protein